MSLSFCKHRPTSADPFRFGSTRPSTAHNNSSFCNENSINFLDVSTNVFLTSPLPIQNRPRATTAPTKIRKSLDKTTTSSPKPSERIKNKNDVGLNISQVLLEVKDEKGKRLVQPIQKLNSNRFHTYLHKFKQQKEEIDNKIHRLETLETRLKEDRLDLTSKENIKQSLLNKSNKNKDKRSLNPFYQTFTLGMASIGVSPVKSRHPSVGNSIVLEASTLVAKKKE